MVQKDAHGDGDVEAFDTPGHRDGDGPIGKLGNLDTEPRTLGADQKETGFRGLPTIDLLTARVSGPDIAAGTLYSVDGL